MNTGKIFRMIAFSFFLLACVPGFGLLAQEETSEPEYPELAQSEIVEITIYPAPEPRPALKHLLLPARSELESGNAAVHYAEIIRLIQPDAEGMRKQKNKVWHKSYREGLTRDELPGGMPMPSTMKLIHRAARQRYCDWQLNPREGINMLLPMLGTYRALVNQYTMITRVYITEENYDAALKMMQATMALGRHVGNDLTLIQALVGNASIASALQNMELWLQQRNAPNLYWALTHLPRPVLPLAQVIKGEADLMETMFESHTLERVRTKILSAAEAETTLMDCLTTLANAMPDLRGKTVTRDLFAQTPDWMRDWLIEFGYATEFVDAIPPEQAHILYMLEGYRVLSDNQIKWFALPYAQGKEHLHMEQDLLDEKVRKHPILPYIVADLNRVYLLVWRTERTIDCYRVIEAIRMFAAESDGKLPPALDAITSVPVPDDPFTGKPFIYRLEGDKAILEFREMYAYQRRYILTIAK